MIKTVLDLIPEINDYREVTKGKEFVILVDSPVFDFNMSLVADTYLSKKKNIILVAPNIYHAQRAYDTLLSIVGDRQLSFFPADEFLSVEMLAASSEFREARLNTIVDLIEGRKKIIVTHVQGYLRKLLPKNRWMEQIVEVKEGKEINKEMLTKKLISFGYKREYRVEKPGDISVRGFVLDVWSLNEAKPIRIEFFDDEVDNLRYFDPVTQRTEKKAQKVSFHPLYEFFYSEDEKDILLKKIGAIDSVKAKSDYELIENDEVDKLQRYVEYFDNVNISDYCSNSIIFLTHPTRTIDTYENILEDVSNWKMGLDKEYAKMAFTFIDDLHIRLAKDKRVVMFNNKIEDYSYTNTLSFSVNDCIDYHGNIPMFISDIKKMRETVVIQGEKAVYSVLDDNDVKYNKIGLNDDIRESEINVLSDKTGVSFHAIDRVFYLNIGKLFKKESPRKKVIKLKEATKISSVNELRIGDYVVHYDYGIGRYLGIKTVSIEGVANDYIHIEYRNEELLYVPADSFNLIQKYSAREGAKPKINSIGGSSWQKTKARVRKQIKDIAGKLVKLYAERKNSVGYAFPKDDEDQYKFESDFEFTETLDQLKAIDDMKNDMEDTIPMDRLLCGDVGYGKTEVAMRGAFKAVYATKQVAYLCPTTVLSKQHYETFKKRFSPYGINVKLLNRFVSIKNQRNTLKELAEGKIDILIGTHRLLSKDIQFKDLGLLIIDEEQRFGVEHKERIKELKINIDVLTLTATPIPRTLQMSLMGVKSTSLLETPPENRYPIQTYVLKENKSVIKDAIERELSRNGQVFYLYNKVYDIDKVASRIQRMVPDARVTFAHGQMAKDELESRMNDFIDGLYDCLVCTTIIETGIDIPNTNTLIVTEADRLGLAQLYQIRGRVGRSDRIAYAYLMYGDNSLSQKAEKRLEVIKEFTELGSGFKIAMRDLSIRGAGNVLGAEQSGFIDSVGIDLYMEMLDEELKGIKKEPERIKNSSIKVSKHIPNSYVSDEEIKVEIHRKIRSISNMLQVKELVDELEDKYGRIPNNLINSMYKSLLDKHLSYYNASVEQDTTYKMILKLSSEGSKNIDGERIVYSAYQVSSAITIQYKRNRYLIVIDKKKAGDNYLKLANVFFEKIV